jgi:predicted HAD superfamily Cof-like phosphohydrolase
MTKVGPDGKVSRSPEGKILKPEGFVPVDLSDYSIRIQINNKNTKLCLN